VLESDLGKKYINYESQENSNKKMSSKSFLDLINSTDFNDKYAKPKEFTNKTVQYGTAGFRTK
jgi:hypothetical protein